MAVRAFAGTVRTLRADLGLGDSPTPGRGPADLTVLHGISPAILPRPADYGPTAEFAGAWWPPPSTWAPPPELERFLADGPAPVYIGFGSAGATQGPRLSSIVSDALGRSGHRAVVQRGWAGLAVSGPDVVVDDDVPHEWLFPRVAAVIHHSGAGTTAAGLRYGRPAVPVPFSQDQPFWAHRLVALGAAPRIVPAKTLRADRLANALTDATIDSAFTDAAAVVSAKLAREDGAAAVLRLVHQFVPSAPTTDSRRGRPDAHGRSDKTWDSLESPPPQIEKRHPMLLDFQAHGMSFVCGVGLCSAVSYSPTPWRVQYHRRWWA